MNFEVYEVVLALVTSFALTYLAIPSIIHIAIKKNLCYKNCKNILKCSNTLVNKRERVERRERKGHYNLRLTIPFIASYSLLLSYITQMTPSPPPLSPSAPTTSLAPSLVLCRSSYVNLSVKRPHKVL